MKIILKQNCTNFISIYANLWRTQIMQDTSEMGQQTENYTDSSSMEYFCSNS